MKFVWPNPFRHEAQRKNIGFPAHGSVAWVAFQDFSPLAKDWVNLFLKPHGWAGFTFDEPRTGTFNVGVVGEAFRFGHGVRLVDSKTVYATIEPESNYRFKSLFNFWVSPIEVWLRRIEKVQIPLTVGKSRPSRTTKHRLPVIRWGVAVAEVVPIAFGRTRPRG